MGIQALERHFNLQILDCTAWLMPEAFSTRGTSLLHLENLSSIRSLRDLKSVLADSRGGYAVDYVGQFSPSAVLLFNELKARDVQLIVVDSGAYPSPDLAFGQRTFLQKLIDAVRHGRGMHHFIARFARIMLRLLPDQTPDYALVAGDSWRSDPRFCSARVKVPAHSFDYEKFRVINEAPTFRAENYLIYLDEDIAGHEDNAELGFSDPATAAVYYPALCKFFDEIERLAGMPVVIAGYPTSVPSRRAAHFEGREVIFGKTAELIRNAKIVFAHASTAISFAVLWHRPLVFLTSNEIRQSWYQPWIDAPRAILSAPSIDIGCKPEKAELEAWGQISRDRYDHYRATFIKARNSADISLWDFFLRIGQGAPCPEGLVHEEQLRS